MVANTDSNPPKVRFAVKDKKDFDLAAVKKAIEGKTRFKVGKVLSGPS
jgi:hypothetical protein